MPRSVPTFNDLSSKSIIEMNFTAPHLITNNTISTRTQSFTQDTTATKYQIADYIIQPLKLIKFTTVYLYFELVMYLYISSGSFTVLLKSIQSLQLLYGLVNLHQLRELQCSNKHKGVTNKLFVSVPRDSHIFI